MSNANTEAPAIFHDARPFLITWAAGLAFALLVAVGWQAGLAGYVGVLRDNSPWTYLKSAERYEASKNWPAAIDMLREAAKRGPASPVPHERMGRILYQERSDWNGALAAFHEALERKSTSLDVRGKTIWSLIHLSRYEEAATFGKHCIEDEGSTSPYFPRYVGEAYYRGGKHALAIPYLEKALDGLPGDMLLMERLQACYKITGDKEKLQRLEKKIHEHEG